jgi:UDP-N-acetyl-D-mannosaminuronic acid dehydrogenase
MPPDVMPLDDHEDRVAADLDLVVLGGGGHVGLPLTLAFADSGLRVGIFDTNQTTLDRLEDGEMPFLETGAEDLLRRLLPTGRLAFSADPSMIGRSETLVVVIGTPVDEFLAPTLTIFEKAVQQIAPHLRSGMLVVLRSTVFPGTTEYVAQALTEAGCTVDVAFCPRSSGPTRMLRRIGRRLFSRYSVPARSEQRPRKPSSRSYSRTRGAT